MTLELSGTEDEVIIKYDNKILQKLNISAMCDWIYEYSGVLHCVFYILEENDIKYNKAKVHKKLKTIISHVYGACKKWNRKHKNKLSIKDYRWHDRYGKVII